jgi:hypothetical protein
MTAMMALKMVAVGVNPAFFSSSNASNAFACMRTTSNTRVCEF